MLTSIIWTYQYTNLRGQITSGGVVGSAVTYDGVDVTPELFRMDANMLWNGS
jgi:hypothetical protein